MTFRRTAFSRVGYHRLFLVLLFDIGLKVSLPSFILLNLFVILLRVILLIISRLCVIMLNLVLLNLILLSVIHISAIWLNIIELSVILLNLFSCASKCRMSFCWILLV